MFLTPHQVIFLKHRQGSRLSCFTGCTNVCIQILLNRTLFELLFIYVFWNCVKCVFGVFCYGCVAPKSQWPCSLKPASMSQQGQTNSRTFVWSRPSRAATCSLGLQNLPRVRLQVRARTCPASGSLRWHRRPSPPCSRNLWVKAHKPSSLFIFGTCVSVRPQ